MICHGKSKCRERLPGKCEIFITSPFLFHHANPYIWITNGESINVFAWWILQIKKPWWKNLKNNISKFWNLFWLSGVPGGPECTESFLHRKVVESWCIWLTGWFSSLSSWALGQVNGQESFHLQSKMGWKALLAHFVHINYTCLQFINFFSPLYPYVM